MKNWARWCRKGMGWIAFIAVVQLGIGACATVQSVSLTQIPQERSRPVQAETSRFIFLGFNFDNDYVDLLMPKLKEQCVGGQVQGVFTKHETIHYFLAHRVNIVAEGYCVK